MERVKVVILMPVGPGAEVSDTLESIAAYGDPSRAIVLIDNGGDLRERLQADGTLTDDVHIVVSEPGARSLYGDLCRTISAGWRYCIENFDAEVFLRMDADALMLAPGSEDAAIARLSEVPEAGLLGSFRVRFDGAMRDMSGAARMIRSAIGLRRGLRDPSLRSFLRSRLAEAEEHGYAMGDHPQGAVCFLRPTAMRDIYDRGWFHQNLRHAYICEDYVITIFMEAAGYSLEEFGRPGDPLAIKWIGLPAHPEEVLSWGSAIVHSVRSWEGMNERQCRAVFAEARKRQLDAVA